MADRQKNQDSGSHRFRRYAVITLLTVAVGALLGAAATIPFYYQSQTLLYKFGVDKILLRSGKVVGIAAACLLLLQIVTSSRFAVIDSALSRKQLLLLHKSGGFAVATLALVHPLLVFWPEDIRVLAVDFDFWPEILGALLLCGLWLIVCIAAWRGFLGLSWQTWARLHRASVHPAVIAMLIHTLTVSDTFKQAVPRGAAISVAFIYLVLWIRLRLLHYRQRQRGSVRKPVGKR